MTWEWVAPTSTGVSGSVGIFFTWLTGSQGRKQADRTAARQDYRAERDRVMQERRNAYLAALELASVDLRRLRYRRDSEEDKLAEVELKWPKSERTQVGIQVTTGVEVYGSTAARNFVHEWNRAMALEDEVELCRIFEEGLALVRRELGTESFEAELGSD